MLPQIRTEIPGPESRRLVALAEAAEPRSIKRQFPLVWKRARGVEVEDVDGNRFLDFTSAVLVTNIGHAHPKVTAALREQADELLHSYNFLNQPRAELVGRLVELAPPSLDRAFIATTGAEVVELAVTAARMYTGRSEILTFYGGFHGKTYATLHYGGKSSSRVRVLPPMPGVIHAPFPYCYRCPLGRTYPECDTACFSFIDRELEATGCGDLAAVLVEPFQGTAGQVQPPREWMQKLAEWCRRREALLIFDEVQSSFGRTGRWFAFEHHGVVPNLVVVGKGISGGVPLTALLGEGRVLDAIKPGFLSSTHGGNPLACRAALATIQVLEEEHLLENAAAMGERLVARLREAQPAMPILGEVRGVGLMIGVEIVRDPDSREPAPDLARAVVERCIRQGLMMIQPIGVHGNVLRVSPPLCIDALQVDRGCEILAGSLREVAAHGR